MTFSSLREGARLALDQLRANKFRSVLTVLGIVVGVATVMAMSALITGIRSTVLGELEAAGPKNFFVARYDINEIRIVSDGRPPWGDNPPITVAEARAIERLPTIRRTIIGIDHSGEFVYGRNRVTGVAIAGRDDGWTEVSNARITAGHDILPNDVRTSAPVVLLTDELAESLFGPLDPVGRTIRVNGRAFEVIGTFTLRDALFSSVQRNLAITPYTSAIKHLNAWTGNLGVFAVTADHATQDEAVDQVITLLRTARGIPAAEPNDFAIVKQEQMIATFNRVTGMFFAVMIALSSVGLMVGGVGVIAIMMIAVTERTREIGIRKAVGATRREILWQFLFEAMTVTVIGAAIGLILGTATAYVVAAFTPIPASVPGYAVVAALSMAATAGILFGIWPAWRAARLDPVEALRYE